MHLAPVEGQDRCSTQVFLEILRAAKPDQAACLSA
jgi:hypothetical protein